MSRTGPEFVADLIGESPAIRAVRAQVVRLLQQAAGARRLPPIVLLGETGTGKGLVARALHLAGPRAAAPFIDVNCAAIPDTLLEAELFGYERGAFTGAGQGKPGLFQVASRGTIFLDEIGLLPEALQSKLLKVVEERQVRRLGATRNEPIDVSIVAATSEDLEAATRERRFRADLYHRLAVVTLRLPPLRERGGDVLLLAEHFLARACADYQLPPRILADDARAALAEYSWPGNVRELANVIERASLLSETRLVPASALDLKEASGVAAHPRRPATGARSLRDVLDRTERERLVEALDRTGWNLSRAAADLGIPRNTLRYRMEHLQMRPPPPSRRRPAHGPLAAGATTGAAPPSPPPAEPGETTAVPEGPGEQISRTGHAGRGSVEAAREAPRPAEPAREAPRPESVAPAARAGIAWQRRRLALLAAAVDPATSGPWSSGVVRALDLVAQKMLAFGGHVEELETTGVVASFGREAVEDAPRRAALAALAIQTSAARAGPPGRPAPALQLAIHVEECEVGQVGDQLSIDAASRRRAWSTLAALRARADPGAILASVAAAESLQRWFDVVALGEPSAAAGPVFRLTGPERTGFAAGSVSPFVGRRGELQWLRGRVTAARAGDGHVVAIVGEAGIGKSRLVFELCRGLAGSATVCAEGRCLSYATATPYLPVAAIVRQLCGIAEGEAAAAIETKLQACLGTPAGEAGSLAYLLDLLGVPVELGDMTPEVVKARTFDMLVKAVLQLARRRALVLVLEDLHWIDPASEELLGALIESVPGSPVLLVLTYRPGYRAAWLDRSCVTQMALPPLSPEESEEVIRASLRSRTVSDDVTRTILGRGQGNPFFLEELTRAVAERPGPGEATEVPATVHDVLAARIARLADAERALLQSAAVVGRDVPLGLLVAIGDDPEPVVVSRLRRLAGAEFLTVAGGTYRFKHALTQEVAYRSLLDAPRREVHARIVEALEGAGADQSAEDAERLAHHAVEAQLWEKAEAYFRQAARAVARSAAREAAVLLERALAALAQLPATPGRARKELGLQMALGVSVIATQGYGAPRVERAYARARELCAQVGHTPRLLGALLGLWAFHLFRGELRTARALAEECLAVTELFPESPLLTWGHLSAGVSAFWLADAASARRHLEWVMAIYDPDEHGPHAIFHGQDSGVTALGYLGWVRWLLGHPGRAADAAARALALADRLAHPFSRGVALCLAAGTSVLRREPAVARQRAEPAVALATEHGFPSWAAMGTFFRGWAMSEQGHAEGITEMRRGLAAWRGLGSELGAPWFLALLAGALAARGDADEALRAADEALAVAARGDERWAEAEIHRVRGTALVRLARPADAEAAFGRAMAIAREQHLPSLELRAATSLVRLGAEGARDTLARLCEQIDEGRDTPDLVEARAALQTEASRSASG
jgi:DNA-binding NtrC family response regulator/predicted ATPase